VTSGGDASPERVPGLVLAKLRCPRTSRTLRLTPGIAAEFDASAPGRSLARRGQVEGGKNAAAPGAAAGQGPGQFAYLA